MYVVGIDILRDCLKKVLYATRVLGFCLNKTLIKLCIAPTERTIEKASREPEIGS